MEPALSVTPQQTPPAGQAQSGLIRAASAQDVLASEAIAGLEDIPIKYRDELAKLVEDAFTAAKDYRKQVGIDKRIASARNVRDGKYPAEKLSALRSAGVSTEFARVVANKGRVVSAWLADIYAEGSEPPWRIAPPADIDVPEMMKASIQMQVTQYMSQMAQSGVPIDPQAMTRLMEQEVSRAKSMLQQQAINEAEAITDVLKVNLRKGGFQSVILEFLHDFAFFPAAILKGPVNRLKPSFDFRTMTPSDELVFAFERVDPENIYPAPEATTIDEGYVVEVTRVTYKDLLDMRDDFGFEQHALEETLQKARNGELEDWLDNVDNPLTEMPVGKIKSPDELLGTTIDCLEYHGQLFGETLQRFGVNAVEMEEVYEASILVIDGRTIRVEVNNDPLKRRPYYVASYEAIPGSFWGQALPDVLSDVQNVANAAIRALVNNMGMASGPQVIVDVNNLADGEEVSTVTPWRIWQVSSAYGQGRDVIQFYQPSSNVGELMAVFDRMYELADELSMTPRLLTGGQAAGTLGRTASGLSMLMNSASKGLKRAVHAIDSKVLAPMIERLYHTLLRYGDIQPPVFGGDLRVTGASSVLHEDTLQVRRNEFLQMTANPIDSQLMGPEGRLAILREVAKGLDIDVDLLMPTQQELEQRMQMQQMQQQQQQQQQQVQVGSGQNLETGQPTTDNFSPSPQG